MKVAYMFKESKVYCVVYGDTESFFGPSEKSFSTKKEAEKFLELKKKELGIE